MSLARFRRSGVVVASALALRGASAQDSMRFVAGDAETTRLVAQIIESAAAEGLPAGLILSKARFAVAVKTPGPKIVETAKAVAARLVVARRAIAPHELESDFSAAEAALSYNVPPEVLQGISLASPKQPIAVPLGVLTQLVADRVPVNKAADIVRQLIRRGATTTQLATLGNDVDADVRLGRRPGEALDIRYNGLTPHLAPLSPQATTTGDAFTSSPVPKKP
jgi:hypothetical protein